MASGRDSEIDEVVREFLSETKDNLEQFESTLLQAEREPGARGHLALLFRSIHSIKGSCGFLTFTKLEALLHAGETLLDRLRDGRLVLDADVATALLRLVDGVRKIVANIEATGKEGDDDFGEARGLLERAASRAAPGSSPEASSTGSPVDEPSGAELEATRRAAGGGKIRVDVGLLDRLMNLVGELVLARNQVVRISVAHAATGVVAPVQRLNLVTTELQEAVMKTRMQPIGNVWSRFPRMVRDVANGSGKQVRLQMEGRETELDKSIIEAIQDPLAHLVRNAIDHGLEPSAVRLARGKPAEGTLSLRAFHEGGMVNIEIADDGAGIDVAQVRKRAVQQSLASADEVARMSDREALALVFLPGFTTADKVTTLSGRGVGMDVVRTNIEKIGGTVDIHTRPGQGTTFKIKIPLTLAIIPALIVGSGGACYAIPQSSLLEVVRLDAEDAARQIDVVQGAPVFRLRGKLLPVAYLNRELGVSATGDAATSVAIVVLQADERTFGLVVDEIRDTEEIVVKPLWKRLKGLSFYAGATVMGDGRVALILDSMGLGQRVGVISEARQRVVAQPEQKSADARREELILLCRIGAEGRLAIPLSAVARLEEFARSRIERVGNTALVQYRGNILPVVQVARLLEERRKRPREPREGEAAAKPHAVKDTAQIVVFAGEKRQLGLEVDGILDVLGVHVELQQSGSRVGILGTMVVQERITEFLDVARAMALVEAQSHE